MRTREELGCLVRRAWVKWAMEQPKPKASWLVPYSELPESDKEADRQIGEAVYKYALSDFQNKYGAPHGGFSDLLDAQNEIVKDALVQACGALTYLAHARRTADGDLYDGKIKVAQEAISAALNKISDN